VKGRRIWPVAGLQADWIDGPVYTGINQFEFSTKEGSAMLEGAVGYIPCRVEPGMFRGEYLVFLDVADPENPEKLISAQALVDEHSIKNLGGIPRRHHPVPAWLRVEISDPTGT
jgi:hypothetical protein